MLNHRTLRRRLAKLQRNAAPTCINTRRIEDGAVILGWRRLYPDGSMGKSFEVPEQAASVADWLRDSACARELSRVCAAELAADSRARKQPTSPALTLVSGKAG